LQKAENQDIFIRGFLLKVVILGHLTSPRKRDEVITVFFNIIAISRVLFQVFSGIQVGCAGFA
jgi:hypothetical protein